MRNAALVVVLILTCSPALAVDKAAARVAYERATKLYDLNQFSDALEEFKKAYLDYDDPAFLYNIAQCHRQLGNKPDAVKFYRSFLRKVPDAPNGDDVRKLIDSLEDAIAREKTTMPLPPPLTSEPKAVTPIVAVAPVIGSAEGRRDDRPRVRGYKKWWVWTVVGVVAAGAAAGIAVGVTKSQRNETAFSPVHVQ